MQRVTEAEGDADTDAEIERGWGGGRQQVRRRGAGGAKDAQGG